MERWYAGTAWGKPLAAFQVKPRWFGPGRWTKMIAGQAFGTSMMFGSAA